MSLLRRALHERYLTYLRQLDEETALARVRATEADLRVWRRDPAFREAERAALAAPPSPAECLTFADAFRDDDDDDENPHAKLDELAEARLDARLDVLERQAEARSRFQAREAELSRYPSPPADRYGRVDPAHWSGQ